jgi:hypothetical protein
MIRRLTVKKILLIIILIPIGLVLSLVLIKALPANNKPPVLYNLGIKDFGPYDPATGRAGAFVITQSEGPDGPAFYPFGSSVIGADGHQKILPEMEFTGLAAHTPVYAAADGWVKRVSASRDTPGVIDYAFSIHPTHFSKWRVEYEHVVNVKIKNGQWVKAGQQIAEVAPQGYGQLLYRAELTVEKETPWSPWYDGQPECPMQFLAPSVEQEYTNAIIQLQKTLFTHTGLDMYDSSKQPYPGCQVTSLLKSKGKGVVLLKNAQIYER